MSTVTRNRVAELVGTNGHAKANGAAVSEKKQAITISAPNMNTLCLKLVGTAPFVQCRMSQKAINTMISTQEAGSTATGKKKREPRNFKADYEGAMHLSREGWHGCPASAFRNAMISACRIVGFQMTRAKLAVFIEADGYDAVDGTPLVKLVGKPHEFKMAVRNDNGSCDIRCRPMWDEWSIDLRVRFDADMFTIDDMCNLINRVGEQVGIGEGRPDSKNSAGMGWGTFRIEKKK